MVTYSIIIRGKVQGVFFRQTAKEKADKLGIKGTVENLPDDAVAIVASGDQEQLDHFVEWCRQGPPRAKVESLEIDKINPQNFSSFKIIRH